MVSSFDDKLADYGLRMYRSFARFNPDVPMLYADFGGFSGVDKLAELSVKVLAGPRTKLPLVRPNFRDMMLAPYMQAVEWDKMLWVDADTLVLRPFDAIWRHNVDFVGHPDRDEDGLVLTCDYSEERKRTIGGHTMAKFATGIWMTNNADLLDAFYARVRRGLCGFRDSDTATVVVNEGGYSYFQLDGNLWNFGRQLVTDARYDGEHVYYKANRRTYAPYAVAFSRVPNNGKDLRLSSEAIDQFYKEKVENV